MSVLLLLTGREEHRFSSLKWPFQYAFVLTWQNTKPKVDISETDEKLAKLKEQAVSQLQETGVSPIDDALLDELVGRMRTIVNNKDAVLVSGSDDSELETVRTNYVVKRMGIEDREKGMAAIKAVADEMSSIRMKNRAAFYYMVNKKLSWAMCSDGRFEEAAL